VRRLALELFGREVCALSFGAPPPADGRGDPGTTASQVDLAEPWRLGFHVPTNPSVTEVEPDLEPR
jgi:hypothetical protein